MLTSPHEIDLSNFPWKVQIAWRCKVSLHIYNRISFDRLFCQEGLDTLLDDALNSGSIPSANTVNDAAYDPNVLTTAMTNLRDAVAKSNKSRKTSYYCQTPSGLWDTNIDRYSKDTVEAGLLLPHISVKTLGTTVSTIPFFGDERWELLKGKTYYELFSEQKRTYDPRLVRYIRTGRSLGVLKLVRPAPGPLGSSFHDENDKACNCAGGGTSCVTQIGSYCQLRFGECTATSDCY